MTVANRQEYNRSTTSRQHYGPLIGLGERDPARRCDTSATSSELTNIDATLSRPPVKCESLSICRRGYVVHMKCGPICESVRLTYGCTGSRVNRDLPKVIAFPVRF